MFESDFRGSPFNKWLSRIGEVTKLQYKNLEFLSNERRGISDENGQANYFTLNLRNRKNWQKREKNGEQQTRGE